MLPRGKKGRRVEGNDKERYRKDLRKVLCQNEEGEMEQGKNVITRDHANLTPLSSSPNAEISLSLSRSLSLSLSLSDSRCPFLDSGPPRPRGFNRLDFL